MNALNRNDIIRMAREAGFDLTMFQFSLGFVTHGTHEEFEHFAAIVAAAERDECAKLVDEEMADYRYGTPPNIALNNAAAAIRARGNDAPHPS